MIKRKYFSRIIALALTLTTVISLLSVIAYGSDSDSDILDYSRPGSQYTKTLSAPDIVERVLNTEISEEERAYLLSYSDTEIRYDDGIPTSAVIADYDSGTLSVSAYEYTYLTSGGTSVVWIPVRASLLGRTLELTKSDKNSYDAVFTSVSDEDDSAVVKITYRLRIEISADLANELINKAFVDGTELARDAAERREAYERAHAQYLLDKAAYEAYVLELDAYNQDLSAYLSYVSTKRSYDAALQMHNEYLADMIAFENAVKAHDEYLAAMETYRADYAVYSEYLSELRAYEKALELQAPDLANKALCESHLAIIDATKMSMTSYERTVYSAVVLSPLVDYVLSQRDLYSSSIVNMSEAVVDLAEESTVILRELLPAYFSLKTEAGRYNFYSSNYDKFCQGFLGLFQSLYYMSQNKTIMGGIIAMKGQETFDKFEILVAQLYLVCSALVDGPVLSVPAKYVNSTDKKYSQFTVTKSNFKIKSTYTQILGTTEYIKDTQNAKPVEGGFPTVVELTPPTPVDEPVMPTYVKKPVEPDYVAHPGDPPAPVDDPGDPPTEVTRPTEPEPVVLDEVVSDLIDALGGAVQNRGEMFSSAVTVTAETTVSKRFLNVSTAVVKFYATGGTSPDYTVEVDSGTFADYIGPVPFKAEDASAVYRFAGWQTEEGELVDLACIEHDLILYPYFVSVEKYYNITWQIGDFSITEGLPYGATPSYAGTPKKPNDNLYSYTFVGWSPEIGPVEQDVTYTAVFESRELITSVPGVTVIPTDEGYTLDATGSFVTSFDITDIIAIRDGDDKLTVKTIFAVMDIDSESLNAMQDVGITKIALRTSTYGNSFDKYTVCTYDAMGNQVLCPEATVRTTIPVASHNPDRLNLRYTGETGEYMYPKYSIKDQYLVFSANPCVEYTLGSEFFVSPISNDFVSISTVSSGYFVGDTVNVNVLLSEGKTLTKLYYRDSEGKETLIRGKSFKMPMGDITVIAVTDTSFHTVKFVSDGKIVTSYQLPYGKTPTPPTEAPKKPSDGEYNYTFVGWSPEIRPVDGDITYTAVFDASPVTVTEADAPVSIYNIIIIVIASVCGILGLGIVVVLIIFIKRMTEK